MPQSTNIIFQKIDADPTAICINITDTDAPAEESPIDLILSYASLDAGEKATVDAFEALAISKLP